MGRTGRNVLGATVVVLVLAAAGCGGGGVDEADATATTVEPSTTSEPVAPPTTVSEEAAVLAAYQGYWDTWLAANDPPDPDHPDLERYATGAALAKVKESIERHRDLGQAVVPAEDARGHRRPVVERVDPAQAWVIDCSVDDTQVVDTLTGELIDGSTVTWQFRAQLVLNSGLWQVADVETINNWEGEAGCAA